MRAWSIGEVARLLGVKPHVLRYWESELPLLSPKKGLTGRREYSANEVRLLMRFRHLLYDRKFTIEGAKKLMWEELGAADPDLSARFARIRSDLIEALMTARRGSTAAHEGETMAHGDVRDRMEEIGQEHLFAFWEKRPEAMRQRLLDDLASLHPAMVQELRRFITEPDAGGVSRVGMGAAPEAELAPAPYVTLSDSRRDAAAREAGEEEIRRGRAAFLTVAGGQGSRLGIDGPKGMFPVTPLRKLTLFALFAEKLLAARRWYGTDIPWLIMTGPQNHQATVEYFESEKWFDLGRDTVRLFVQGSLPSFSPEGRLIMAPDGGLLFNPNGHGGVIEALRQSGSLAAMREQRVEHLFYFQVDNPLVRVPDPVFLGFHCRARSRISAKVVEKAYPEEKLGIIVTRDGKPSIIEYSDLDEERMHARGPDGRLYYGQGSIAIHILDVPFLENPGLHLPWHMARKNAKMLNPTPEGTEVLERDAVKLEMFVFDAIPLADRALFFETDRAEEFAPLKNREGQDSVASCLQGQREQAARWLSGVGVEVPRDGQGRPLHAIEISPLFALDPQVLAARRGILKDRIDEDTVLA
jgi:UDP-N-acetylglucosamine/UDP-N-acetylgalactosamine diphosphorylase